MGLEQERWSWGMLVQQHSADSFLAFADNADCPRGLAHRSVAIEDSRLLPWQRIDTFSAKTV